MGHESRIVIINAIVVAPHVTKYLSQIFGLSPGIQRCNKLDLTVSVLGPCSGGGFMAMVIIHDDDDPSDACCMRNFCNKN